jgi:hypothetical protein
VEPEVREVSITITEPSECLTVLVAP